MLGTPRFAGDDETVLGAARMSPSWSSFTRRRYSAVRRQRDHTATRYTVHYLITTRFKEKITDLAYTAYN